MELVSLEFCSSAGKDRLLNVGSIHRKELSLSSLNPSTTLMKSLSLVEDPPFSSVSRLRGSSRSISSMSNSQELPMKLSPILLPMELDQVSSASPRLLLKANSSGVNLELS